MRPKGWGGAVRPLNRLSRTRFMAEVIEYRRWGWGPNDHEIEAYIGAHSVGLGPTKPRGGRQHDGTLRPLAGWTLTV